MNTLNFYKRFLKKVRFHLGEPAHLTALAYLHLSSPLVQISYISLPRKKECCFHVLLFLGVVIVNIRKDPTLEKSLL